MEDFFSLVQCGDLPQPEEDTLSKCVFPQARPPAPAQQSAVAFTGIGKSSAVVPGAAAASSGAGGGGAGKRTRGGGAGGDAAGGGASRLKQAKTEPT